MDIKAMVESRPWHGFLALWQSQLCLKTALSYMQLLIGVECQNHSLRGLLMLV